MSEKVEPKDSLSVTLNGKPYEVFMSFGLLNKLLRLVGNPDNIAHIGLNADLNDAVLLELLSERDSKGKVVKPLLDLEEVAVSMSDCQALLDFVQEHLWAFMVRKLEGTNNLKTQHGPAMARLTASLIGSLDSTS